MKALDLRGRHGRGLVDPCELVPVIVSFWVGQLDDAEVCGRATG